MSGGPLLLGLEIGGTKLQLGVRQVGGQAPPFEEQPVDVAAGAAGIRAQIEGWWRGYLDRVGLAGTPIAAVGIGFGGPVDADAGTVLVSNQVSSWEHGFPLRDWAAKTFNSRCVVVQNDADTAGLGEATRGAGVGYSPLLYVNSGSGVGGALIIDGAIYRGAGLGAVEIGHLWIEPEVEHRAGRTLEQLASGWSIGRRWQPGATGKAAFEAAARGDAAAQAVVAQATRAMGIALAHAVTLLAPRRVVLGGGSSQAPPELWLEPIRREVDRRVFGPFRGRFDIVTAALGQRVVVEGALALAERELTNTRPGP